MFMQNAPPWNKRHQGSNRLDVIPGAQLPKVLRVLQLVFEFGYVGSLLILALYIRGSLLRRVSVMFGLTLWHSWLMTAIACLNLFVVMIKPAKSTPCPLIGFLCIFAAHVRRSKNRRDEFRLESGDVRRRTGGKQYRVSKDDVIEIERLEGKVGDKVKFDEVLLLGEDGKAPKIGAPTVSGASVVAEVVEQTRADKVTVIKFKRRKNYHRTKGHRQHHTVLKITGIAAKAAAKAKAKAAEAETEDKSEE